MPAGDDAQGDDAEGAELVGVTWVVTGFVDGAQIDPPSGPGQVRFERNGFVTGSDGCNGFGYANAGDEEPDGLAYEIIGHEIRFTGSPVSTLIGCTDSGYEARLRHVLSGEVTYDVDGGTLALVAADGGGVIFAADE